MKVVKGIKIAPGIAVGPVYRFERYKFIIPKNYIKPSEIPNEVLKLRKAISKSVIELTQIKEIVKEYLDEDHAKMIDAQLMALTDEEILKEIREEVCEKHKNITWAYYDVMNRYEKTLEDVLHQYHKERNVDLRDVKKRIIHHLSIDRDYTELNITEPTIFVSEKLHPSDLIQMNHENAIGIITKHGGMDSHVAILARAFSIPYLSDVREIGEIAHGDKIYLDADNEVVIIDPDEKSKKDLEHRAKSFAISKSIVSKSPDRTFDKVPFEVLLNAGFQSEVKAIDPSTVKGIGLFRTEFLCMEMNSIPDENEQFEAYKNVVKHMKGLPVTFRIFDFTHDKFVEILNIEFFDENKLLDRRGGIRFCLDNPSIFVVQLHSIMKASIFGKIKIMLPMVHNVDEVKESKAYLEGVKGEFRERGISYKQDVPFGIMVETKEALDNLEELAKEVDFFSIGTNDLALFLLETQRNETLAKNYYHPTILKAIDKIIRVANKENIPVTVCGEMASDLYGLIGLIALGVRSVSVNLSALNQVTGVIRNIKLKEAELLRGRLLNAKDAYESFLILKEFCQKFITNYTEQKEANLKAANTTKIGNK